MTVTGSEADPLVARLRAAGCVFAEDEARVLRRSARDEDELAALLAARVRGEPLEQLVGWVDFGGLRLEVGPGVFVPRRRTLHLADAAVAALGSIRAPVFVEAFAGVAPVAATVLAALPHAEVHVTDIDPLALRHARSNLHGRAGVHRGSVVAGLPSHLRGRVSVIAAVPPYVPVGAAHLLPREAVDHEPPAALFGGSDGLGPARALIAAARGWLAPGGRVLIEMNTAQAGAATRAGCAHGFAAQHHDAPDGQTTVLDLEAPGRPRDGGGPVERLEGGVDGLVAGQGFLPGCGPPGPGAR